jgi:glutathionyl-hydroquinone reductase
MGLLVNGEWQDRWYDTASTGGRFLRKDAAFRQTDFGDGPPVAGRYHLIVSHACPWAHRTLIVRALKGLEDAVSVSAVHPDMLSLGWEFKEGFEDPLLGAQTLFALYQKADPHYTGRVTVPVLWDKQTQRIVNNESSEIIRLLDGPFAPLGRPDAPLAGRSLRPPALQAEIDAINGRVYETLNNGVYRCGFATSQQAYDEAVVPLFETMEWLEERLRSRPWLAGDAFTEADVRLFTTLFRFDPVYHGHFKCSLRRLVDHPQLFEHTRAIYQLPGVAALCHLDQIRRHYYYSHDSINPHRVVPVAPDLDYGAPADRGPLFPGAPCKARR